MSANSFVYNIVYTFPPFSCNFTAQTLDCVTPAGTGNQSVTVNLGAAKISAQQLFSYGADPVVDGVSPNCTLLEGEEINQLC